MKRFAMIAINSSLALSSVEAKPTRTTKIVQTVKRKRLTERWSGSD